MTIKFGIDSYKRRLSHPNKKLLNKELNKALTDTDLTDILGKSARRDIVKYSELNYYTSLEQLLPKKKCYKIILIEDSFNSGHWVVITRLNNMISYFNSYGGFPSIELDYMGSGKNKQLGQSNKTLNHLLEGGLKNGFQIQYNKKQFQELKPGINTCGKHCLLFIIMNQKFNYNLNHYIKFMDDLVKHFKLSPDQVVSLIIDK